MDTVAQGAVWSDLSDPVIDVMGSPVTDGEADITITLIDSADVDQSSGITVTHSTGGRYRVSKTLAANAALGAWGGTLVYDDGAGLTTTQSIDFSVVASGAVVSAVAADETLTLTIGHAYLDSEADALPFTDEDWTAHDLDDEGVEVFFVALRSKLVLRKDMTVENATTVQLELTASETIQMRNAATYRVYALLPGQTDPVTLVSGALSMQST